MGPKCFTTPPYRLEMLGGCILVPGNISGPTAADTDTFEGFFSGKIEKNPKWGT